jgi:tyrosine-protein kinase Etk/Wzc
LSEIVPRRPPLPEAAPRPPQPPLLRSDPADAAGPGEGIPMREYLGALRRHLWLVVAAVVVSVGIAAYRIRQEPPRYTAVSAVKLVNARQEMAGQIGTGQTDQVPGWYTDPILSQIQVLRSRAVAREVVDSVGGRLRPEDPEFPLGLVRDVRVAEGARAGDTLRLEFIRDAVRARMGTRAAQAAYGQPLDLGWVRLTVTRKPPRHTAATLHLVDERSAEVWAIGSMAPAQREMTNVIDIHFTANDPVVAQRAANAAAASFQAVSMRSAQTLSRRRRVFVEDQLRSTDSLLALAQMQLSAFRRGVRAFSPREKFRTTEEGLANLRLRRQALQSEKGIYDQMGRELQVGGREGSEQVAALAASPEVATNGGMVALYNQLIKYTTSRDSLTTGRWSRAGTNPDIQQLDSLIATYRGRLVRAVRARSDALAAQIGVLDDVMATDAASITGLPDAEAEEMRLSREVETLQKLVDDLRRDHQEARIDEAVEAGQVEIMDWASAPGSPVGTGTRRRLLFALLVGLMIGGGGALVLDRLNTALVRREDAEAALHTTVIAVIPRMGEPLTPSDRLGRLRTRLLPRLAARPGPGAKSEALVTVSDLHSAGSQAYRKLRTHLIFSQGGHPPRTLLITSPAASEGKTTVSANLATTFAQQGLRVVLVDADMRRPRMHGVFGLSRTPGLTEVLQNEAPLEEGLRETSVEGLHVLGAGRLVAAVSELLGGAAMGRLLRELNGRYDVVVVDTPPVLAAADAEILAAQADAVLMVVRAGQTERQSAHYAMQQLRAVGARIVGAVLNDPDQKIAGYGKYAYYYDYYADAAD